VAAALPLELADGDAEASGCPSSVREPSWRRTPEAQDFSPETVPVTVINASGAEDRDQELVDRLGRARRRRRGGLRLPVLGQGAVLAQDLEELLGRLLVVS
jgi:hypothetical protein